MTSIDAASLSVRTRQAARYLLAEHGTDAVAEAGAALRYARVLKDQETIEVFEDIIELLEAKSDR